MNLMYRGDDSLWYVNNFDDFDDYDDEWGCISFVNSLFSGYGSIYTSFLKPKHFHKHPKRDVLIVSRFKTVSWILRHWTTRN